MQALSLKSICSWDITPCDIKGLLIAVFVMTLVLPKLLLNMSQIKDSFIGSKIFSEFGCAST